MWNRQLERFAALLYAEDSSIKKLGEILSEGVRANRERALERERNEAIFGRG